MSSIIVTSLYLAVIGCSVWQIMQALRWRRHAQAIVMACFAAAVLWVLAVLTGQAP